MKKNAFVPSADNLESRTVMSGIPYFHGTPLLTGYALGKVYTQVEHAFQTFANKGENYKLLEYNLGKAVNRIPFNVRDGLFSTVQSEASTLQGYISDPTDYPHPVKTAYGDVGADIKEFVQYETSNGIFVYHPGSK